MGADDEGSGSGNSAQPPSGRVVDRAYVRLVYAQAIDWYKVAESKAQIILTVNGVLVTIFFGLNAQILADEPRLAKISGVETWCFLFASTLAVLGAVTCATACLWSRHGKNSKGTFALLGVNPDQPHTYCPEVLWYFGDLANLQMEPAAALISRADAQFEVAALSYNVVHLGRVVLRKHRFLNTGWALTATAIVSLIFGGVSVFVRAQM
ncbi:hypothetical protein [Streptomyces sp. NPDC059010]|uniref:hypothetical protein n=1 Tax=Streptomyces sp. NPDC059010 TaxID=3346695 RepID=UPI003691846C